MKKLILTVLILANGFSGNAFVRDVLLTVTVDFYLTEGFVEVAVDEKPEVIINVVKKDYTHATLVKAYVNSKGQYKLELKIEEIFGVVYADKDGNWIERNEITDTIQE